MAGLPPSHPDHADLARTKTWTAHASSIQASWLRVRDGQLATMAKWRKAELPAQCPVGNTLFYPFSGPDFFNAYTLFPDCDNYVLFGLEPVGELPDPAAMQSKDFAILLNDVRRAMLNMFERNYFVTSTMSIDLRKSKLQGVVPVLTMSMVLAGAEVVRIGPPQFPRATGGKRALDGVTIEYRVPGSPRPRRLTYYSVDVSNKGLAEYPAFEAYLRGLGPTTTLVKAASYLMHIVEFSRIRSVVLDNSGFLLQDDTGVPYNFLLKRGFDVQVYGDYGIPIPPFTGHHQKELAAAFDAGAKPLPFRFGYFRDKDVQYTPLIVARRAAPAPQPVAGGR